MNVPHIPHIPVADHAEGYALALQLLRTAPCLLCRHPRPELLAAFIPSDPVAAGLGTPPPGRGRVRWYRLCDRCARRPFAPQEVENVFLRWAGLPPRPLPRCGVDVDRGARGRRARGRRWR